MDKNSKIYVAGHTGLVGSAIVRNLTEKGYHNLIYKTIEELDLTNQQAVLNYFNEEKPEYVILAAAKVGGINANNTAPGEFIYQNLMIESNVIHSAHLSGVKKLLFLGSSCIYPRITPQPIKEEALLSGLLEPTNEAYAIAKIAGLEMCKFYRRQYKDNFISCMPTNLYGPMDNFNLSSSHVLPALLRKIHEAKSNGSQSVEIWGTGTPLREFMHVDDMADACVYLLEHYNDEMHINIGTGEEISIRMLAEMIKEIVGFTGVLEWNTTMPDGTPRKLVEVSRLHELGWRSKISLKEGIKSTYHWYQENYI